MQNQQKKERKRQRFSKLSYKWRSDRTPLPKFYK